MQIIIDEGISESSDIFKRFLKRLGNENWNFLFLSKTHPGMPDVEIIDKLLPEYQNILTRDRVLHNRVIAKGFKSTLSENGSFTNQPLKHIKLKKVYPPSIHKEILEDYSQSPSEEVSQITSRLLSTLSENSIKKNRSKRRRIFSYFGSVANISSIDFTIASETISNGVIGGYYLKINAKQSLKALLNASEGYCLDQTCSHILGPVFYALSHLFTLHLSHIPINIYLTSHQAIEMCQQLMNSTIAPNNPLERSVKLMLHLLSQVTFTPCTKGPFFDRMQAKLNQVKNKKTNELVTVNFKSIAETLSNCDIL